LQESNSRLPSLKYLRYYRSSNYVDRNPDYCDSRPVTLLAHGITVLRRLLPSRVLDKILRGNS